MAQSTSQRSLLHVQINSNLPTNTKSSITASPKIMTLLLLFPILLGALLVRQEVVMAAWMPEQPRQIYGPNNKKKLVVSTTTTLQASGRSANSPFMAGRGSGSPGNYYGPSSVGGGRSSSKRQERVGQLVQTELSRIIHRGTAIKRVDDYLEDSVRQRISVVSVNVSPDLKQARVSVSIRDDTTTPTSAAVAAADNNDDDEEEDNILYGSNIGNNAMVDKRRAYSWLVRNTKPIKHAMAQRLSHLKTCPSLTFHQVDVAAAVDVMYLIDKIASAANDKRDGIVQEFEELAKQQEDDYDEDDDMDWDVDDEGFFS